MKSKMLFVVENKEIEAKINKDESLLDLALRYKIPLQHSCGGMGTCGTCRVFIRKGTSDLPPAEEVELVMIKDRGFDIDERLACQVIPKNGIKVEVPLPEL